MLLSTPIHPLIVHFPIAMLILGTVAQIVALFKPDFFSKAATWLIAGGFIAGIITYMTGDAAEEYAKAHLSASHDAIETHESFALMSLIAFGLVIALKILHHYRPKARSLNIIIILISLVGAVLIGVTGHYGGQLVYTN